MIKSSVTKICICISAAAAAVLNISSAGPQPVPCCSAFCIALSILIFRSKDALFAKPIRFSGCLYPILSTLICSAMGYNFYCAWLDSGIIDRISRLVSISNQAVTLAISVIGTIAAIPAIAVLLADFSEIVIRDFGESPSPENRKTFG